MAAIVPMTLCDRHRLTDDVGGGGGDGMWRCLRHWVGHLGHGGAGYLSRDIDVDGYEPDLGYRPLKSAAQFYFFLVIYIFMKTRQLYTNVALKNKRNYRSG